MSDFLPVFGTKFFIGSPCAVAPFPAVDQYVEILAIDNFGDQAESVQDVTQIKVDQTTGMASVLHFRAERSTGNLDVSCYWLKTDPGQLAVQTAYRGPDDDFNFKAQFPDGSVVYYQGPVVAHNFVTGVGSNIIARRFSIALNEIIC